MGGANLYGFCGNDPVNGQDYIGLDPITLAQALQNGGNIRWVDLHDITMTPYQSQYILQLAGRQAEIYTADQIRKNVTTFWPWMDHFNPFSPYNNLKEKFPNATCDDEIYQSQADWLTEAAAKNQLFQWLGKPKDKMNFALLSPLTFLTSMLAM